MSAQNAKYLNEYSEMRRSRNPGPWVMGGGDGGDSLQAEDSWSSSFLNILRIILRFEHSSNALLTNRLNKRCLPKQFFVFFAFLLNAPDHVHSVLGPQTDRFFSGVSRFSHHHLKAQQSTAPRWAFKWRTSLARSGAAVVVTT